VIGAALSAGGADGASIVGDGTRDAGMPRVMAARRRRACCCLLWDCNTLRSRPSGRTGPALRTAPGIWQGGGDASSVSVEQRDIAATASIIEPGAAFVVRRAGEQGAVAGAHTFIDFSAATLAFVSSMFCSTK
jgi:hypothetical protein